jgi:hypothetical protein
VLAACDCTPERPACNSARHWTAACPYPAEHASPQPSTMSCKHVAKRAVSSAALAAADMLPGGWYMRRSCQQELLLQPHRTTGRTSGRRRYCCLLPQLPHNAPITRLLCPQRHGNPNMAVAAWRVSTGMDHHRQFVLAHANLGLAALACVAAGIAPAHAGGSWLPVQLPVCCTLLNTSNLHHGLSECSQHSPNNLNRPLTSLPVPSDCWVGPCCQWRCRYGCSSRVMEACHPTCG